MKYCLVTKKSSYNGELNGGMYSTVVTTEGIFKRYTVTYDGRKWKS